MLQCSVKIEFRHCFALDQFGISIIIIFSAILRHIYINCIIAVDIISLSLSYMINEKFK